jgi:predicted nucleic acid-binding protein
VAGVVIDASVAVKWFILEERSAASLALHRENVPLIAPDVVVLEVFSALWAAVPRKRVPGGTLDKLAPLIPGAFSHLVRALELYAPATTLSSRHDHPIYDTLFIALAAREQPTLVTADEGQFEVARRARVRARLL